jgi:hypothetical protein
MTGIRKEDEMRKMGWEERLRALDEMAMAFHVARGVATNFQGNGEGWLRTVRRAVGIPVAEAAGRIGVKEDEVFRMEHAERRGVIELQTLRRAAEALGCVLVYGLAPKEGTLQAMAVTIEAGRAQRRAEAWARKLEKAKEQRLAAARKRWGAEERERLAVEWREYWRLWSSGLPLSVARQLPKPKAPLPFWRERMRKALKTVMRKEGIRTRSRD